MEEILDMVKRFTTPGVKETREILIKMSVVRKSRKTGRANLEAIKDKLEKCQKN
jgi:hypothetical protein